MNQRDRLTIARILKVNHAGEFGAIRIYRAQLWVARRRYPDVVAFLEETLGHEIEHCTLFRAAMPERNARPCRVMSLWSLGGFVLGGVTALLGRQGIWICTAAVEEAVHRHLEDQLHFLENRDPALHKMISDIQEEELSHLQHATDNMTGRNVWASSARVAIAVTTDVLIWLSTWGDSTSMSRELAQARVA